MTSLERRALGSGAPMRPVLPGREEAAIDNDRGRGQNSRYLSYSGAKMGKTKKPMNELLIVPLAAVAHLSITSAWWNILSEKFQAAIAILLFPGSMLDALIKSDILLTAAYFLNSLLWGFAAYLVVLFISLIRKRLSTD
jgi:hypothetical protein